jgi:hypothetical protein
MKREREPSVSLQVRLPVSLHAAVKSIAAEDDRSLNAMIVRLLREAVARREPPTPLAAPGPR